MDNPLLVDFSTPFGSVPFEEIENKHFLPAIKEAIKQAWEEIESIAGQKERPDFQNTLLALEQAGERLSLISAIFFNLHSAETNEDLQTAAREISTLLTEYGNNVFLNAPLFERIQSLWERKQSLGLDPEQQRLLEKVYRSFTRNGAGLSPEKQVKLRAYNEKLASLSLQFGENFLAETNDYKLFTTLEALEGLPENDLHMAQEEAEAAGRPGEYLISLQAPSYLALMTYAKNRALREQVHRAYGQRAFRNNEHDNRAIVKEIAALRAERAALLGFESHAAYVLAERMAKTPQAVEDFLGHLENQALALAKKELAELEAFAKAQEGLDKLQAWDLMYFKEKLKQQRFQIEEEKLKPYFELSQVLSGVFAVANKLYGLQFSERNDLQKYHPDVQCYQVLDEDGEHLALFYADFFPRPGKRSGAWMTSYREQAFRGGEDQRPQVSIVCNFPKPSSKGPSLLGFNDLLTLFHEFGHALHGMLARGRYASLSGTNVLWDFVELPSQLMENWCYQPEALKLFARHHETGAALPQEWIEALQKSAIFMEAYATIRQLSLAKLDLAWHQSEAWRDLKLEEFEAQILADTDLFERSKDQSISCSFSHIFQGGYSAGYYSYKWAEVLDADAFELFLEKGLFDSATAKSFRRLLESGDAVHPAELYRRFRGKDPDPQALLRRAGLIAQR